MQGDQHSVRLDRTDLGILRYLQERAGCSDKKSAARFEVTVDDYVRRVRRLEAHGYIRGYVALVERSAVELPMTVLVCVTLSQQSELALAAFEERIAEEPSITECYSLLGEESYFLKVVARDLEDFSHILRKKLLRMADMARISSAIVVTIVKESTAIPLYSARNKI